MGRRALFHDLSRCISKTPNQILLGYLLRVPGRYPYVQFIQYTTQILTYCTYVPRRTVPTSTEQQRARHDIIVIQLLLSGHASVMISSHPPWRKLRLDSNCPQPERRRQRTTADEIIWHYLLRASKNFTMSLAASRVVATRALARRAPVQQQKRGIFDYLTNYPDKVRHVSCRWRRCVSLAKEPGYGPVQSNVA